MSARVVRILLATAACAALGFLAARHRRLASASHPPSWPDATLVHVPHLQGSITLDGDADDPGWRGPCLRTGGFVGPDGASVVHPYSEARILWGDGFVYMNLYAADEDIRVVGKTRDSLSPDEDVFHVLFTDATTERVFDINPLGVLTDGMRPQGSSARPDLSWDSHAHVSHELDGTPNQPGDNDEEWVLEVAIPFEALGLRGEPGERIGMSMHRCDKVRSGKEVCGAWGETKRKILVLDAP